MEPRYKMEDFTANKIVGVKIPGIKKPQWAVYNKHSLFLRNNIALTFKYENLENQIYDCNEFTLVEKGQFSTTIDKSYDMVNKRFKGRPIISLDQVVSVDIKKCHISDEVKNQTDKELLMYLDYVRRFNYCYITPNMVQRIIETKAELLNRKKGLKPDLKNNGWVLAGWH